MNYEKKKETQPSLRKIGIILALAFVGLVASVLMALNYAHASTAGAADTLVHALTTEPPVLDSTKATDAESFFVLGHVMEGLTRLDANNKTAPGVAEKWEINDKGAKFYLRKNAKWSDGTAVTAHDFVFALRTTVDPKTASEYSFIVYPLKNGEAINQGKLPVTDLGVKALDDHTLEFTFERPCGYFLGLTSFAVYQPIKESFYRAQKGRYAADAENMLYNGPFKLAKWTHGASMRLEKNQNYWNAKAVQLAAIDIPYITPDESARLNLFKTSKIDVFTPITKNSLPVAQQEKMKLSKFSDGTLFYMMFNFREGRPTANKNLRKAIEQILNSQEYVSKVVGVPGTQPGTGLVPDYMQGLSSSFRKENPMAIRKQNIAEAKRYLELAKKELGGKIPALVWLTGDTPVALRESEYFQGVFKNVLGIELKIDVQIFKQRLKKAQNGDFDIVSAGWGPDYADPMTFIDLFATWNNNNNGKYASATYDELVKKAQATSVQKDRMAAMAKAEKVLMDDLAILPLYQRAVVYSSSPRVKGIVRRAVGFDPDFTHISLK